MNLNFKEFGKGDPVIILHGLFGTSDNWQSIAKKLASEYTVFIVDQRNHGRSPHTQEFNYRLMAEDIRIFLENQWVYKCNIIGHSMGGKTAMQFALDYPDVVEKLVIVDIANQTYHGDHEPIFEALFSLDLEKINTRKEADEILKNKIDDFGLRQFLLKNLTRNTSGKYQWKMNLPVIYENYEAILSEIHSNEPFEGTTLFVKGGSSNYIKEKNFSKTKNLFPNAELITIENTGHWVHAEAPDQLLEVLRDFLA